MFDYKTRIQNAQALVSDGALLVSKDENLRYFTGVDSGRLLIWKNGAKFWLNPVYFDRAKDSYVKPEKPKEHCTRDFIISKKFRAIECDSLSLADYNSLDKKIKRFFTTTDICEQLRKIKDKEELKLLSKAGKIASDSLKVLEGSKIIGMTEYELAALIEYEIRRNGSEKPPFSMGMLCLSGPNTRFPHAPTTSRKVREGDLVVLDLGAVYEGYYSDMTRTLKIGNVSKEQEDLVSFLDNLRDDAIDLCEPGVKISNIHNYIEEEIKKKGFEFAHLSGHGVGLEIHEKPSVGPSEQDVFQDGMVFTIEPGIYGSKYGARSEDTIALVDGKKKILTK